MGLFGLEGPFPVWARFSSDVPDSRPDRKATCGLALKLYGVPGHKLDGSDAETLNLVFQNHDVFFVDNARAMCELTRASLRGELDAWLAGHPDTAAILRDMEKDVGSVLGIEYSSVIPFRFGSDRSCKLSLVPTDPVDGPAPDAPEGLARDLARRLEAGPSTFQLMVQVRDGEPPDRLTERWCEPAVRVATLHLDMQAVNDRGQAEYGEALAFDPWRTLPEHEPLGSVAAARRVVYAASAAVRRDANGTPRGEPEAPRPAAPWPPAERAIVRCAIHPAIGVARVGNSPDGYFIGPEVPDPPPAKKSRTTATTRESSSGKPRASASTATTPTESRCGRSPRRTPRSAGPWNSRT